MGRMNSYHMPPIDKIYTLYSPHGAEESGKLTKVIADQLFFANLRSDDVSTTLSALTMNGNNISAMKDSGSIGMLIELLRRHNFAEDCSSEHVSDMVKALHVSVVFKAIAYMSKQPYLFCNIIFVIVFNRPCPTMQ